MKHASHEKLVTWKEIDRLDIMIQEILQKIPKYEYKLKSQIDSASDSIGSNLVEGYYSGSLNEYVRFLRYSRRSCGELQERIRRTYRKRLVNQFQYTGVSNQIIRTGYLLDQLIQSLEKKKAEESHKKSK